MSNQFNIGIDPGLEGAIALSVSGKIEAIHDMPVLRKGSKRVIDVMSLYKMLYPYKNKIEGVIIEKQFKVYGQRGATLENYGAVLAILQLLELDVTEVTPSKWKKEIFKKKSSKEDSVALCQEIFPEAEILRTFKRKDPILSHDRAEACLLLEYARRMK